MTGNKISPGRYVLSFLLFIVSVSGFRYCSPENKTDRIFQTFPDQHTVALWLFDETEYPYTTLCDAGESWYDLRLMSGGHLKPGIYGNALVMAGDSGHAVSYAGFAGKVVNNHIRNPDGQISGLWGPTEGPERLLKALSKGVYTFECRLKIDSVSDTLTLFDMGQGYEAGFSLFLDEKGILHYHCAYSGLAASVETGAEKISDGDWHHIAFSRQDNNLRFYLDGTENRHIEKQVIDQQPLPDMQKPLDREHEHRDYFDMSFDERRRDRFNIAIGHRRAGGQMMFGAVDEIRFSDIERYERDFEPPASFSRKKDTSVSPVDEPGSPSGPELLFDKDRADLPLQFGLRKHVFIDDAIIDSSDGVRIVMNQPGQREMIDFQPEKSAWRPTVVDIENKVYLYVPAGYSSARGRTYLYTSEDGLHFSEHEQSPVITDLPLYGTFFEDANPAVPPEEKYKLTAWIGNRGIHLFFSPDGIRWRRNETLMLPLVSGGGAETYYDDQKGRYVSFIRRDSSFDTETCPGGARQCIMFETGEPGKTWPFRRLDSPYYEGWTLPAVTCEGPAIFDETSSGQAYRSRAIKYPWAPDVYLAFVWRYPSDQGDDPARHVDLGASRNGTKWRFFEPTQGWYIPTGDDPDPEQISIYGLVRRGDEIWQYTDHGGPHGGSSPRTYYRWKQRLDGFVSLDGTGYAVTRPLVFTGKNVSMLINSTGSIGIGVSDEAGKPFAGFSIQTCDRIPDAVGHTVTWSGNPDLSRFSGEKIRLRFELSGSKLYSFELADNP